MPAAAVIPAPIVYIKVVAVKNLVVGFLKRTHSFVKMKGHSLDHSAEDSDIQLSVSDSDIYFDKIRVFQAGLAGIR